MYQLKYKIWLEEDGKLFGKGPYELLQGVSKYGSLSESAKSIKMSYNKAFHLIKDIEKKLGYTLISTKTGGSGGGGSQLTPEAKQLMETYAAFMKDCDEALEQIFNRYFSNHK